VSLRSPGKLKEQLRAQNDNILRQIEREECLSRLIEEQIESINLSESEEPFFRIERNPALLRLQIWRPQSGEDTLIPFSQINEWMNHFPFVSFCVQFPSDDIQNRNGDLECDWGIAMEEWIANILKFSPRTKGEYIPARSCIHILVNISDGFSIASKQLDHVRQFMNSSNLIVSGPAICMRIFSERLTKKKNSYVGHLWIPIERKQ
jgi:hypothetical protein